MFVCVLMVRLHVVLFTVFHRCLLFLFFLAISGPQMTPQTGRRIAPLWESLLFPRRLFERWPRRDLNSASWLSVRFAFRCVSPVHFKGESGLGKSTLLNTLFTTSEPAKDVITPSISLGFQPCARHYIAKSQPTLWNMTPSVPTAVTSPRKLPRSSASRRLCASRRARWKLPRKTCSSS